MNSQFAIAPNAPGAIGEDVPPHELLQYLDALHTWRDRHKTELDQLDQAALHSTDRDALTSDILLSMALWQAVAQRCDLLVATWDSGRVLEPERRRMTTLIWGRLDQQTGTALGVSLPEACRLSDTLAASLRARLRLDGSEPDVSARIRDLRAGVERIRDQVALIPPATREQAQQVLIDLDRRLVELTDRARRGADVGGLLPALEATAARTERDLIVAAATRARAKNDLLAGAQRRDELAARGQAVARLAEQVVAAVSPAPRLAVPDVTALPEPSADAVAEYLARLDRVDAALTAAHQAYSHALARRDDLTARLAAAEAAAAARCAGLDAEIGADAHALRERAAATLARTPVDLTRLSALVAAHETYLHALEQAQADASGSA